MQVPDSPSVSPSSILGESRLHAAVDARQFVAREGHLTLGYGLPVYGSAIRETLFLQGFQPSTGSVGDSHGCPSKSAPVVGQDTAAIHPAVEV